MKRMIHDGRADDQRLAQWRGRIPASPEELIAAIAAAQAQSSVWPHVLIGEIRRLRREIAELRTDQERLDWLEVNCDDLILYRDASSGTRVELDYCSEVSGCPVKQEGDSLRAAIDAARRRDA